MKTQEIFFKSYNKANEAAYAAYFRKNEKNLLKDNKDNINKLDSELESEIVKWSSTPLDELGGSPLEYIRSIDALGDLIAMFRTGAVICDDQLPEVFLERLKSFGVQAEEALFSLSRETASLEGEGDTGNIPIMAIRVLGWWKSEKAVETLVELLKYEGQARDLLYESVRAALTQIGKPAAERIMAELEAGELGTEALEHLAIVLSEIGAGNRSEAVYRCLKNLFLKQPFKATAAACLAVYGDGRAIPALRGFIEKNGGSLDKNTFYEVISAIRDLGGRTDDLSSGTAR